MIFDTFFVNISVYHTQHWTFSSMHWKETFIYVFNYHLILL